ncbi:MAG: hypothetical protein WD801_16855 [Gemmatimonadaceae bacterium]
MRFHMRCVAAVILATVLLSAGGDVRAQEPDDPRVRRYEIASAVSITASLATGVWSVRSHSVPAISVAAASAAVGYGLFLTSMLSESVSSGVGVANLVGGVAAGYMSFVGFNRHAREKAALRREQAERLSVVPVVSSARGGGLVVVYRF